MNMLKKLGLVVVLLTGCSITREFGVVQTLYLTGSHGEPPLVLNTKGVPEPRSLVVEVYQTPDGKAFILRDYQGKRGGDSKTYQLRYGEYPNGERGLGLFPVKIGIQNINPSKQPENPSEEIKPTQENPDKETEPLLPSQ